MIRFMLAILGSGAVAHFAFHVTGVALFGWAVGGGIAAAMFLAATRGD